MSELSPLSRVEGQLDFEAVRYVCDQIGQRPIFMRHNLLLVTFMKRDLSMPGARL